MILISANPATAKHFKKKKRKATTATGRKAPKKGASAMAKKHRTPAQVRATKRLVAWTKAHRGTKKNPAKRRNPYHATAKRHHKVHRRRNPSSFAGKGLLKEILSKDGLLMVAGAFAAPMATDWLQEKIMPSATGWTKVALKAGLTVGVAFAIDKFLKMRKVALAYGVTGLAVTAADAVNIARGQMAGLSASEADMLANRPDLIAQVASGGLGGPYTTVLAEPYRTGLAGGFKPAYRAAF